MMYDVHASNSFSYTEKTTLSVITYIRGIMRSFLITSKFLQSANDVHSDVAENMCVIVVELYSEQTLKKVCS